jgi:hypothetical protein
VLGEVAAADPAAAYALLSHAASIAGADVLKVKERPGSCGGDALENVLAPPPRQAARYYLRVPDVTALLDHLRPVLSARLAASDLAQDTGELVISFFRDHVRIPYTNASVGRPRPGDECKSRHLSAALAWPRTWSAHYCSAGGIRPRRASTPDVYLNERARSCFNGARRSVPSPA